MPATPNITLMVTLQDFSGNDVQNGYLSVTLCNFGPILPRVAGTSMLAKIDQLLTLAAGTLSLPLYGNDQITPGGTYYSISVLDDKKNVVQCGIYQFTGSATVDLSTATQISAGTPFLTTTYFAAPPIMQSVTGTINGINTVFTFMASSSANPLIALFVQGIYQTQGVGADFTLAYSGSNVWTITFAVAPVGRPITLMWFQVQGSANRTITGPVTIIVSGTNADNTLWCNFSAPGTIFLPSAATAGSGYVLTFTDVSYNAATKNITLSGSVNQGANYVINTNGGSVTIKSDGAVWRIQAKV